MPHKTLVMKNNNETFVFVLNDGSWKAAQGLNQTDAWHVLCQEEEWNPTAAVSLLLCVFRNDPDGLYHPEFDDWAKGLIGPIE